MHPQTQAIEEGAVLRLALLTSNNDEARVLGGGRHPLRPPAADPAASYSTHRRKPD